jgi:hypothetical protein
MARKATAPKAKVWHVFRFDERYELPEDMRACRKSGLQYTRDFVGIAAGDEAVGYHCQFDLLANGDGLDSCLLYGVYRRIVNIAAGHSRAKRGYLIGADDRPLTDAQIGRRLNIKSRQMKQILAKFRRVQLLEQIELPAWDMSLNDPPDPKRGNLRKSPEKSGKKQTPLKKTKRNPKRNNKQKAPNGATAKRAAKEKTAHVEQSSAQEQAAQQPRPSKPLVADAGAGDIPNIRTLRPPRSVSASPGRSMGPTTGSGGVYNRFDYQYARRIYEALGYQHPANSIEAIREMSSFASTIHKALEQMSGLPPPVVDAFGERCLVEARKIGRRRDRNHNAGAVWTTVVGKIVNKRLTGS